MLRAGSMGYRQGETPFLDCRSGPHELGSSFEVGRPGLTFFYSTGTSLWRIRLWSPPLVAFPSTSWSLPQIRVVFGPTVDSLLIVFR